MKKRVLLLMTAVLSVGLIAGCGDKGKTLRETDVEKYVTLGDYKNITANAEVPEITDEMIDSSVESVWENMLTEETGVKDREVKKGDVVYISFVGKKDGVAFEGGTGDSNLKIGSDTFIPGFEDGLIGVMPGKPVELNLTFPEDYRVEDLAGEDVIFEVTVHYIGAELTDANVKLLSEGQYNTVDEFRDGVGKYMASYFAYSYREELEKEVLEQMISICAFRKIPGWMTEKYEDSIRESLENTAEAAGTDADTYCTNYYGMNAEDYISAYAEPAAQQGLAFQAIANAEDLNVDDEELNSTLESYIEGTEYKTVEEFVGDKDMEEYREYFMFEKVLSYLCDVAVENGKK